MPEEKLITEDNGRYFMAAQRSAALRDTRAGFIGRVIHSSTDAWKRGIQSYLDKA